MRLAACMGGLCHLRDSCGHYHADDRRYPHERMCPPGAAFTSWIPIRSMRLEHVVEHHNLSVIQGSAGELGTLPRFNCAACGGRGCRECGWKRTAPTALTALEISS